MISKLVVWGGDRAEAIARLRRALERIRGRGNQDDDPVFPLAAAQPDFVAGRFDTTSLDRLLAERARPPFIELPRRRREDAAAHRRGGRCLPAGAIAARASGADGVGRAGAWSSAARGARRCAEHDVRDRDRRPRRAGRGRAQGGTARCRVVDGSTAVRRTSTPVRVGRASRSSAVARRRAGTSREVSWSRRPGRRAADRLVGGLRVAVTADASTATAAGGRAATTRPTAPASSVVRADARQGGRACSSTAGDEVAARQGSSSSKP